MRAAEWKALLTEWDRQQESFNPSRERRFHAMFDLVDAHLPARFRALDLGCGPGPLSARLLERFPSAKVVAVDVDPVVQRIGREALGDRGGRLAWVRADLGAPGWSRALPSGRFDAALSTTALHWLSSRALHRLYRDLHRRLRPGGLFVNGDFLPYSPRERALLALAAEVRGRRYRGAKMSRRWKAWEDWWRAARRRPELRAEFAIRRTVFPGTHAHQEPLPLTVHERALRAAGFRNVGVVWSELDDRVLVAQR